MAKTSPAWPADAVTRVKVADLIPNARNARTHSPEQIAQLVASIREWGWTMPILVDEDGQIIAGHGRVLAADVMALEDVPTMTARGWSEAQKRAYMIADNKLALNAAWEMDELSAEFIELKLTGFDLNLTGFDGFEIGNLLMASKEVDDLEGEWSGMPGYDADDPCYRKVVVNFDSAEDVARFFEIIEQADTGKTKSIWFPKKERRDLEAQRWSAGDGAES